FFFSSRRRHTRFSRDWSSDVCSSDLQEAFDKIAQRIEAHMKRFYLLSYCTPARKGSHEVRIVAKLKDTGEGSLAYTFVADGFGQIGRASCRERVKVWVVAV